MAFDKEPAGVFSGDGLDEFGSWLWDKARIGGFFPKGPLPDAVKKLREEPRDMRRSIDDIKEAAQGPTFMHPMQAQDAFGRLRLVSLAETEMDRRETN